MPLIYIPTPQSSNIAGICYKEKKEELFIEFNNQKSYIYTGVSKGVYDELMAASSQGQYLAANIRSKYNYFQVTPKLYQTWAKKWEVKEAPEQASDK